MIIIMQNSLKTTYLFRKSYINHLKNIGLDVVVVAINDSDEYKEKLKSLGIRVLSIDKKESIIKKVLFLNHSTIKLFNENAKAQLQCHFISTIILTYFSLLLNSDRVTVIIEGVGSALMNRPNLVKLIRLCLTKPKFKRIFMNYDEKKLLGKDKDLVLKGIGIEVGNRLNIKSNNNPKENKYIIAYAGRLVEDKGILDCFKVLEGLMLLGISVTLEIYGDVYPSNPTSLSPSIIEKLKEKYGDHIRFNGFVDNLDVKLSEADVLLLPSKLEGFPVVVMQASNVGTPSVVYNVPGCRDAVLDGVNGFVLPINDIQSLISKIKLIFEMSHFEKEKLQKSSLEYSIHNFDVNIKNKIIYEFVTR